MNKDKKPNVNFIHVFGCKYFVLKNQDENLENFKSKADELYIFKEVYFKFRKKKKEKKEVYLI